MMPAKFKVPLLLSKIILVLAAAASACGLFVDDLYQDNVFITAAWRGNDFITLVVVVPIMLASVLLFKRSFSKAHFIWLGSLGYMLYNYIFYLYGAAFNKLFLFYVALFSLSVFALVLALIETKVETINHRFYKNTPVRWISVFMLFFAIPWSLLEISRAIQFIITRQIPEDIIVTGHPTGLVYATDLSLLMPAMILGAVLLWHRKAWGYLLSSIILFKAATYGLALVAMSAFADAATGTPDRLVPIYVLLSVGGFVSLFILLTNISTYKVDASNAVNQNTIKFF